MPASLAPDGVAIGSPPQLWPCPFPLRTEAARSERLPPWRCQPWRAERDAAADAPCRDVAQVRRTDTHTPPPEPFPPGSTKEPGFPDPGRLPSAGPASHHHAPEGPWQSGQAVTIPRLGRPGPSLDMFSRGSARPACVRLFTGGDAPHAAYRLLQQIRTTNTPVDLPDLDLYRGEWLHPHGRKLLTNRATRAPLRETNRPGFLSPGVALYRYATPVKCDRSLDGFTPT